MGLQSFSQPQETLRGKRLTPRVSSLEPPAVMLTDIRTASQGIAQIDRDSELMLPEYYQLTQEIGQLSTGNWLKFQAAQAGRNSLIVTRGFVDRQDKVVGILP